MTTVVNTIENSDNFHACLWRNAIACTYNCRYNTKPMKRKCPVCGKLAEKASSDRQPNAYFPFCSRRCQLVDLGAWLDGAYRVPQEPDETHGSDEED